MIATGKRTGRWLTAAALLLAGRARAAAPAGAPIVIKLGTITPDGSPWAQMIHAMGESWTKISHGEVKLTVYPGGVLGDEPDMVKKMRIGQLHAAGLSTVGVSLLDEGLLCLHLPMMFTGYDEMDWVRDRMIPTLEADLDKKGFVMLCWTDGGWAHFFSKKPIANIQDLRKSKLFVWAGDAHSIDLYTTAKFHPVPLAATDMLPALQTGLIDTFDTPPLAALLNQWFGLAPYMLDLKWGPLMGGVLISKKAWEKIPPQYREPFKQAARDASKAMSKDIRKLGDDAVPAMVSRGLKITQLSPDALAEWRKQTEEFYTTMRGKMGPADYTDQVLKLRAEYRATKGKSRK